MVVNRVKKLIHQHRCFEIEEMKWVYRCSDEQFVLFLFFVVVFFGGGGGGGGVLLRFLVTSKLSNFTQYCKPCKLHFIVDASKLLECSSTG